MNFKVPRTKHAYIRVNVRGQHGATVCRVSVGHLNKRGINDEWDRVDAKYPSEFYISCLEGVDQELRCFEDEPELLNQ